MADIQDEIAAYEKIKDELEAKHLGKWIVLHDGKLFAVFDSFETAAEEAVKEFGAGPYLIRQVGAPPMTLPASVMFRPVHDKEDKVRF
jgi:hypothetical protein